MSFEGGLESKLSSEGGGLEPQEAKKANKAQLYAHPRKTAFKSDRLKKKELNKVPLGIRKAASFADNCAALRLTVKVEGAHDDGSIAWTPAEAHFQMSQMFRNWQTGGNKDEKARVYSLKAFIEQEWPEEFETHKDAK